MPPGDWTMTIRVMNDAEIARLHLAYFHDPSATDVITFPSGDDFAPGEGHLGDVAVSVDTAKLQADDIGHSVEREVAYLGLHGLLHLLGHDDTTSAERDAMLALQAELLDGFESGFTPLW